MFQTDQIPYILQRVDLYSFQFCSIEQNYSLALVQSMERIVDTGFCQTWLKTTYDSVFCKWYPKIIGNPFVFLT